MKKTLQKLFNFYINSSLHVAIAVVCLCAVSFIKFGLALNKSMLVFIFLATITSYNFVKYAEIARFQHRGITKNLRIIQIFSFFIFLGLLVSVFYQPKEILIVAGLAGGLTIFYALPVLTDNKNLRAIPGAKIFIIATVVSVVTVVLPLLYNSIPQRDFILEVLQRFLLVIALILPFEIRDLRIDLAQLETIPQKMGVARTKWIGYFLVCVVVFLELLKQEIVLVNVFALLGMGIVTLLFVKGSTLNQQKYYASFWVEAIPIFWFLFLISLARFS